MGRNNHALVTGLFLLVLISATATIVYWIGHFQQERNLYVISTRASVSGLNPESTVFFRGIAVGKVLRVLFDPKDSGIILVPIEVDKNVVISKGVYATLHLKGVTGLTQIELEDKGKIQEALPIGDNPLSRIPLELSLTDKLLDSGEELLRKADHLMVRIDAMLSTENEKNVASILSNVKNLSDKLFALQKSVDKALAGVPELSSHAQTTLSQIDALTHDLAGLSQEVKTLSKKANSLADVGSDAGGVLMKTTLPEVNKLLVELQTTSQQVKRVADMLEDNPQALLLGPKLTEQPGPGEPGYEEPK